jgi:hypothetical protein
MTRWPDGSTGFRPRSRLVKWWLAWQGEPFTWAIEPLAIGEFLAARGFRLQELASTGDLSGSSPPLDGENLAVAWRA